MKNNNMFRFASRLFLSITLLMTGGALDAYACRGPESESRSLLTNLPISAEEQAIVAEVRVLERRESKKGEPHGRISVVEVIKPIKGTQVGERYNVLSEAHSCAGDLFSVKVGESYYIAGNVNDLGVFIGIWRGQGKNQKLVRSVSKQ